MTILKELSVGKIIIGPQGKISEQYIELCKIAKEKEIPIINVKRGNFINIERNVKINILFPTDELIKDNILNNNSIVARLEYKDLKILFTGDIEEIAEKELLKLYDKGELKADILKVGHHGSKTSTSKEFLNAISPSTVMIGVGENNTFGHPNKQVINRFKEIGAKIYRTDKMGEIIIKYKNNNSWK